MFIKENMFDYEITINQEDLIDYGKSMEQIMEDLIEASYFIKKPLASDYECRYEPSERTWYIRIKKEISLYERYQGI